MCPRAHAGSRIPFILAVALGIVALASVVTSFLPPDVVTSMLRLSDGSEPLRGYGSRIVFKLRLVAGVASCAVWLVMQPRLSGYLVDCTAAVRSSARRLQAELRVALSTVSGVEWAVLGGLTAWGGVLRVSFIERPLLWDEGTTLFNFVLQPWWVPLAWYPDPNNHVLNSVLASVSTTLFGPQLWALRLPAAVAGALQIPAAWGAGRLLYGPLTAMLSAGLVACSSVLVAYSASSRGYTIVGLCFLVLLGVSARLRVRDEPALWLVFAVVSALGAITVPIVVYPVAMATAWMLGSALIRDHCLDAGVLARRLALTALATAGLVLVLYTPVLVVTGPYGFLSNPGVVSTREAMNTRALLYPVALVAATALLWSALNRYHRSQTRVLPRSVALAGGAAGLVFVLYAFNLRGLLLGWPAELRSMFAAWGSSVPLAVRLLMIVGLLAGLLGRHRPGMARLPLLAGLAGPAFLILLQRFFPSARISTPLVPALLIAIAAGWTAMLEWTRTLDSRLRRGAVVGGGVGLAIWLTMAMMRADWLVSRDIDGESMPHGAAVSAFLATSLRPGDSVVEAFPSSHVLRYHLWRSGLQTYLASVSCSAGRTFVVVNNYYDRTVQTPESVLGDRDLLGRVENVGPAVFDVDPVAIFVAHLRVCDDGP